jgi:hypothetical protein
MADEEAKPVSSPVVVEDASKSKGKSKSKDKDKSKNVRGAATGSPGAGAPRLTLAEHPRAARSVARAKAWGGLVGFVLGGYLSLSTHTLADAGLRALAAGVVCYVAAWAIAVFLWRRLVVAELSHARQELLAAEIAKLTSTPGGAASSTGRS